MEQGAFLNALAVDMPLPEGFAPTAQLSLSASGDLLRSPGIEASKDLLFEGVADVIFCVDLAIANYESPVTTGEVIEEVIGDAGPPVECAGPAHFYILTQYQGRRFDALNLANNHIWDMGAEGVATTLATFADKGVAPLGINASPEACGAAQTLDANGIKLGFASATFGLNGREPAAGQGHVVNVSALSSKKAAPDLTLLKAQIDDAKQQGCDFIVAIVHWGHEFEHFPRAEQVQAARALAEHGADAVLCHHPHVTQPVEIYTPSRDPGARVPIAYSQGSLTWGYMAPHICLNLVLRLDLAKGAKGARLTRLEIVPVLRSYDGAVTRIHKLADLRAGPGPVTKPDVDAAAQIVKNVLGADI